MLLLVKLRNAGELFWDSLDTQERAQVLAVACYLVATVVATLAQRHSRRLEQQRELLKQELLEEIRHG